MITIVRITGGGQKQLSKVPAFIQDKLYNWKRLVNEFGLEETRKRPGYHDEPLRGDRKGQRSIRLNRAYRAIYEIRNEGSLEFVSIEEVNKHEY